MTTSALNGLSSASGDAVAADKCFVRRALTKLIWRRALRAAQAELMALDDRTLKEASSAE